MVACFLTVGATNALAQPPKENLEETMDSIVRTLSVEQSTMLLKASSPDVTSTVGRRVEYFAVSYDGCKLKYDKVMNSGVGFGYELDLGKLVVPSEAAVKNSEINDVPKVYQWQFMDIPTVIALQDYFFTLKSASTPVEHTAFTYDFSTQKKSAEHKDKTWDMNFQFQKKAVAEKMVKAFAFAIRTCGGKPDPF